jgi:hypothetical protein
MISFKQVYSKKISTSMKDFMNKSIKKSKKKNEDLYLVFILNADCKSLYLI